MTPAFIDSPRREIVEKLSFDDYRAQPGINNSSLSLFDEFSGGAPALFKYYMEHPQEQAKPTAAKEEGSCYHAFVLDANSFDQYYVVRTAAIEDEILEKAQRDPKCRSVKFSPMLGVYRKWAEAHENAGRCIITQARSDELHFMREALFTCAEFVEHFGTTHSDARLEVSLFAGYEFTRGLHQGLRVQLKCRLDILTCETDDSLLDLKSARTAHQTEFARQCWKLNYHRQAAFGLDIANANGLKKKRFGFLTQDKFPPYLACIHWVDSWIAHGRQRYKNILSGIADCVAKNEWPGYCSGELEPPEYALAELESA